MPEHPLISIIMAARNTEPYIAACLDSILAQTYVNWELIAVNDRSTDRTNHILLEYAQLDKRIKVYDSEGELLIPALQTGLKHAKGELINRMDSDDKMPHDKLEVMVDAWIQKGRGWIIAGGTEHFVDDGEVGEGFRKYERWLNNVARNNLYWKELYRECVIPSHCWLVHREDFQQAGAFDRNVYPEDYDLSFRFYREGFKVHGLDKVLHFWRDRSDRISRTWDVYKDNRYYELKLKYFYELDRNRDRPMVLWGAGRNGKDMAKHLLKREDQFHWVCDNDRKIGLDIYGQTMKHFNSIKALDNPQIIVAVSSPDGLTEINELLGGWGKALARDYWWF